MARCWFRLGMAVWMMGLLTAQPALATYFPPQTANYLRQNVDQYMNAMVTVRVTKVTYEPWKVPKGLIPFLVDTEAEGKHGGAIRVLVPKQDAQKFVRDFKMRSITRGLRAGKASGAMALTGRLQQLGSALVIVVPPAQSEDDRPSGQAMGASTSVAGAKKTQS